MNTFVKRTIFGTLYLVVMLGSLLFFDWLFAIVFSVITLIMMMEYYKMTCTQEVMRGLGYSAAFFAFLLFYWTYGFFSDDPGKLNNYVFVLMGLIIGFLALAVSSICMSGKFGIRDTLPIYAGLVYIALPMALSNAVVFHKGEFSGLLMVSFFCIIWASDVGAYCFGMLFGQRSWSKKMCPTISPKKSWAGFWGGMLMAMLAGAVLYWTGLFTFPIWHCLIVAALMHVMGVFGDLFESLWKRAANLKDSGKIIPGHGGLMDRLDSALFAIPAGFIYLVLFGLI